MRHSGANLTTKDERECIGYVGPAEPSVHSIGSYFETPSGRALLHRDEHGSARRPDAIALRKDALQVAAKRCSHGRHGQVAARAM